MTRKKLHTTEITPEALIQAAQVRFRWSVEEVTAVKEISLKSLIIGLKQNRA